MIYRNIFMNMEKRSAKHEKSTTNFYSLEKQAMKQNLPVLNPYVSIERLELETLLTLPTVNKIPHTKQTKNGKKARAKCESSDESESNSEEAESNSEESESNSDKSYEEIPTKKTNTNSKMSDYEKQIQKNLEDRKKMFEKLVGAAKKDFMGEIAKERTAAKNPRKRKWVPIRAAAPLSMSLRIRDGNSPIQYNEDVESDGSSDESYLCSKSNQIKKHEKIAKVKTSSLFTLADPKLKLKSIEDQTFFKQMIPMLEKEDKFEKLPADQQEFLNVMKSFSIPEKGVAKVSKAQINCFAWHPSNYKLLVAVGSSDGNVGFWDIDKLEDKYQGVREFNRVHKLAINCINFDKFNPMRLQTSGRDGCVRYLDLDSNVWDKIYNDESTIACHAQKNSSTLLICSKGNVSLIDSRTKPNRIESKIQCFKKGTCTVNVHPQDENLFMTSDRSGELGIFDTRYTATNDFAVPVVRFPNVRKRVNGTFFSPITGQYVLTSYANDTLKLYDVQKGKLEAECIKSMHHYNPKVLGAGKLSPFRAIWHPQREDVFIIGGMKYPYRVEMYDAPSGKLLHKFKGDSMDSATSLNVFHPTAPVFAACNLNEIFIFRS